MMIMMNCLIKHENDEIMGGMDRGDHGRDTSGTADTEVWWPGKLAISRAVDEDEDDGVWRPGKITVSKLVSGQ
jgi:hypothetical protein